MKFIGDIKKQTWEKFEEQEEYNVPILSVGFVDDEKLPVRFDKLSFGMNIFLGEEKIGNYDYPAKDTEEQVSFEYTDQEIMPVFFPIVPALAGRVYTIFVWAKNAGQFFSKEFKIMIPLPDSMNPSARDWDEEKLAYAHVVPFPKEFPEDGFYWSWNEETESWEQDLLPVI